MRLSVANSPDVVVPEEPKVVFDHLVAQASTSLITIIPAELVSLHAIHLPVRTARQRLDALPFALEELVAQDLEKTHFALLGATSDGGVLAASLGRTVIEKYRKDVPDSALVPEQLLLSQPDPSPTGAVAWRTYRSGARVLVRASDQSGFAVRDTELQLLWELAGKPRVENLAEPLSPQIEYENISGTQVTSAQALLEADLRQGAFQPARGFARPLKWLAASVALFGIIHLAVAAFDTSAQGQIADGLRAQAASALAGKLANASPDDPPALLLRRLAAENSAQGGSGFLLLMDRVSSALGQGDTTVQFRELNWSAGALRLTVEASNLDALQKAEASLVTAGLQVNSGSATASDGAARAEMTVRP